jgi:hypothetical protein
VTAKGLWASETEALAARTNRKNSETEEATEKHEVEAAITETILYREREHDEDQGDDDPDLVDDASDRESGAIRQLLPSSPVMALHLGDLRGELVAEDAAAV